MAPLKEVGSGVSTVGHSFVGGTLIRSSTGATHPVVDPSTGETVETVELAGPAEVDAAVAAARRAFPEWSGATPATRSAALVALARLLAERADEFARVESRQAGKPIKLAPGRTWVELAAFGAQTQVVSPPPPPATAASTSTTKAKKSK